MKELFLTMMMISRTCFRLIILLVWAFALNTKANAQTTDFKARLGTSIQKKITKDFSVSLEYEHRFDQQLSTFDKAFLEPSLSYDVLNDLKIGVAYRAVLDQNKTRERSGEQRISSYIRYRFEVDDFEIKLKTALQYGFDDITNPSFSYKQKLVNRNKIEIEYNWFGSKITPSVSYEIFYHSNHPEGGILNQWRLSAGASYKLSKASRIQLYYLFENEFNVARPVDAHVLGLAYSYRF